MDYRSIIESRYDRQNWQELLYDIFRSNVHFWQQPQRIIADESMAKSAYYTGKIDLPDGHTIAVYEVELNDSVVIERNRAGIRNLLCSNWRGMGCSGAFMFCYRRNEAVLRFSYVSEAFTFAEDGSLRKDSTDTKRFTYLLGEGHRSRTAIQQFEKLKASGLTLGDITKAFSVEALSDLFFREYKKQYEDIIEFITGKRMVKVANKWEEQVTGQPCREIMQEFSQFTDAEKAVRDYVKKLMGRLVFIQFLQKKGWMGCSAGEVWNDGDREFVQNLFAHTTHKNTFVDDVLEPLFADINTKRTGDIASNPNVGTGIKIPYLNGGLFEKDEYDKTNFPLPAKYMKNLLDFFASYNFTIDENDPDDAEIGVDPEMLGRIFENLLEDNKDKGAFYTPKSIVEYMCRESLTAYLQTEAKDADKGKIAVKVQYRERPEPPPGADPNDPPPPPAPDAPWLTREETELTLTETEPRSGVFTGRITPKILATNETAAAGEIAVQPEDRLQVVYTDERYLDGKKPAERTSEAMVLVGGSTEPQSIMAHANEATVQAKKLLLEAQLLYKWGSIFKDVGLEANANAKADEGLARVDDVFDLMKRSSLERDVVESAYEVRWNLLLVKNKLDAAIATCRALVKKYPDTILADRAFLQIANANREKDTEESRKSAIQVYNSIIQMENSPLKPEAQFRIGEIMEQNAKLNARFGSKPDFSAAMVAFKRCADAYPNSSFAGESIKRVIDYYISIRDYNRAQETLDRVFQDYPDAPWLDEMLLKWGVVCHRLGNRAEAIAKFHRLLEEYPGGSSAKQAAAFLKKLEQ